MKRSITTSCLLMMLILPAWAAVDECITCHMEKTPTIFNEWKESAHGKQDVSCLFCHSASPQEADAFIHHGAYISTIVSPQDCGACHENATQEYTISLHANAVNTLKNSSIQLISARQETHNPDNLACETCHGSVITVDPESPNKLAGTSWKNHGVGRINPDGSLGSCSSCHGGHRFSKADARKPEACTQCHQGENNPQKTAFESSIHGFAYANNKNTMNFDHPDWVAGVDYKEAPTCVTCHMGATPNQPATHNIDQRLSWALGNSLVIDYHPNWPNKRLNMKDACVSCHEPRIVDSHFEQLDATMRVYNEKIGEPLQKIINLAQKTETMDVLLSEAFTPELLKIVELESKNIMFGAAMQSPDYSYGNGMPSLAQTFYSTLVPTIKNTENKIMVNYANRLLNENGNDLWFASNVIISSDEAKQQRLQEMYSMMFLYRPHF